MNFTTDDNYTIKEGSKIYYTGDMANCEGTFIVAKIEPCNFYRLKVTVKEEGGEGRKFNLNPANFDPGPGRRFKPIELRTKERMEGRKRLHEMARKMKEHQEPKFVDPAGHKFIPSKDAILINLRTGNLTDLLKKAFKSEQKEQN